MKNLSAQQAKNLILIAINSLKKLFIDNNYVMYQKVGGTVPMTKCPKCGRVRVAMGVRGDKKGKELKVLDICSGRFDSGESHCDYYFKLTANAKKLVVPQFGNRCARMLYNIEGNAAYCVEVKTNDCNFVPIPKVKK
jgi:hypothetical protein